MVLNLRQDTTTKDPQDSVAQNRCSEGEEDWTGGTVSLATKLDYRWIDLRVPSNQVGVALIKCV